MLMFIDLLIVIMLKKTCVFVKTWTPKMEVKGSIPLTCNVTSLG
jgi:hypothetical protein